MDHGLNHWKSNRKMIYVSKGKIQKRIFLINVNSPSQHLGIRANISVFDNPEVAKFMPHNVKEILYLSQPRIKRKDKLYFLVFGTTVFAWIDHYFQSMIQQSLIKGNVKALNEQQHKTTY